MNILITGHDAFHNKGCQALIYTTTKILKQTFPGTSFTIFSWEPEYDSNHFYNDNIESQFIRHRYKTGEFSHRNRFWYFLNYYLGMKTDRFIWVNSSFYESIKRSDLLVVSGGDVLGDYGDNAIKHYFFPIAVAIALRKPVYVFAQSISKYMSEGMLSFARYYLNKVKLITVRERVTYDYLRTIDLKAPCYLTADPAFVLEPCNTERLDDILEIEKIDQDSWPLIGISASKTVTKWSGSEYDIYVRIMAEVCDNMVEKYGAKIVFIPHVSYPKDPNNDDRIVAKEIRSLILSKDMTYVIEGDYSCAELKALIGKCKLFIGARTHATIASTSQAIPTIAIAYSTKAYGIMKDIMNTDHCICDAKNLNYEEMITKIEYAMENIEMIKKEMVNRLENIKMRAQMNGRLCKEVIFS